MEIGSSGGGGGEGGGGGGGEDLHGLKFGKKIYFEDAAAPASGSGGGGAAPSSSKTAAAAGAGGKKGKGAAGGAAAAPPRCQVEGCDVDLTGAKAYYCRHKVCGMHSKAPRVVVAGLEQRFCQQCSRFHQLPEFDQGKRSCRRRLAGHNERRRKPPPGPLSPRYGGLAASFHEPGRFRSYLLDFSYPRVPSSVRDVWPTVQPGDRMSGGVQWQGNLDLHPHDSTFAGYGAHVARPPVVPAPELPPGGCLAGVAAAAADSSCALSLLSTQPWGTTTHSAGHSRASVMPAAGSFDGSPVAPSVMASNYMAAPAWTSARGHEASRAVPPQLPHEVALDVVPPGQFSGELELALQGNRLTPPPHADHGSGSALDSAGNTMHWSR